MPETRDSDVGHTALRVVTNGYGDDHQHVRFYLTHQPEGEQWDYTHRGQFHDRATAEATALAVNNHAALVEALRAICAESGQGRAPSSITYNRAQAVLDAVDSQGTDGLSMTNERYAARTAAVDEYGAKYRATPTERLAFAWGYDSRDPEIADLRASNQALREALETLEWDDKSDPYDSRCSQCLAYSMNGHEPDCTIRAALAADARREGLDG